MTNPLRRAALVSTVAAAAGAAWLDLRLRPRPSVAPPVEPGRHAVRVVETRRVAPGPGLPSELCLGASNNNLDAVRHADGWTYLAFRTAPHHFASPHTAIAVMRSRDEIAWEFETRFAVGTDLREPRLLSLGDRLFLYVSRLGRDAFAFEPQGMAMAERDGDGAWSELTAMGPPGVMGWRVRKLGTTPVFLVYSGGETIYNMEKPRLRVELWRSDDGRSLGALRSEAACRVRGRRQRGRLRARRRRDALRRDPQRGRRRDGLGLEGLQRAARRSGELECRSERRKYDSPCMFWHDGEAYLVARRNLRGTGEYDLGSGPGWLARACGIRSTTA